MFSYKNFLTSKLGGSPKSRKSHTFNVVQTILEESIPKIRARTKLKYNSPNFSTYSLPSRKTLPVPRKRSTLSPKQSSAFKAHTVLDLRKNEPKVYLPAIEERFKNRVSENYSKLNREYTCSDQATMKSVKAAKKYLPIQKRVHKLSLEPNSISPRNQRKSTSPKRDLKLEETSVNKTQEIPKEVMHVKGKHTSYVRHEHIDDSQLKQVLDNFSKVVDHFKRIFSQIDHEQKSYVSKEDLFAYFNKLTGRGKNYISEKVDRLISVADKITLKSQITKNDFVGLCAVYAYNFKNLDMKGLIDKNVCNQLSLQVSELLGIFECYSDEEVIKYKDLTKLCAALTQEKEVWNCIKIVSLRKINFSVFLQYLPFFIWLHQKVVKKLKLKIN